MITAKVFIDGESGTTGLGIRERLAALPSVTLKSLPSERRRDPAARREIMEETGLKLTGIRFELVQDCIEPPEFYRKAHFLLLNYTAMAAGTDVALNDEAETYRWLSPDEAAKLDLNGPTRLLLDYVRSHPRH